MINGLFHYVTKKMWSVFAPPTEEVNSGAGENNNSRNTPARSWVTKNTHIHQAWESSKMAPLIFSDFHLPNCDQCAVRYDESLAEAAEAYQLPLNIWMVSLNFRLRCGPLS
jgi:hypothetical protein